MSLTQFFTCFKQNEKDTRSLLKDYHIDLFPCHTSSLWYKDILRGCEHVLCSYANTVKDKSKCGEMEM